MNRTMHASAIGHGITVSIEAAGDGPNTVEAWTYFCLKAASEARAAIMADPPMEPDDAPGPAAELLADWQGGHKPRQPLRGTELEDAANVAAAMAFRCCMPQLTSRRTVQAFIACVAVGVQHNVLSGKEATALLYTAQLALSAYPKRNASKVRR